MGLSFTIAAGPRQRSQFADPNPTELMTTFYCLRFETPQTWRARSPYLYPPGNGWTGYTRAKVKVKVTLRLTVSRSVRLGVEPHLGLMTRYLLLFDSYGLVLVGRSCQRSLSRVRVSWDSRPYISVSDSRLPFSLPPTTRRVTVEVFDPASTRVYTPAT
jgi:hypothetical protein